MSQTGKISVISLILLTLLLLALILPLQEEASPAEDIPRTSWAGTPTAVLLGGTSCNTTQLAPIRLPSPTRIGHKNKTRY